MPNSRSLGLRRSVPTRAYPALTSGRSSFSSDPTSHRISSASIAVATATPCPRPPVPGPFFEGRACRSLEALPFLRLPAAPVSKPAQEACCCCQTSNPATTSLSVPSLARQAGERNPYWTRNGAADGRPAARTRAQSTTIAWCLAATYAKQETKTFATMQGVGGSAPFLATCCCFSIMTPMHVLRDWGAVKTERSTGRETPLASRATLATCLWLWSCSLW